MNRDYINQLKEQLTVELEHFIVEPNNSKTQRQIVQTIQDIINKFNGEGRHITVDADLMSELNDIQLILAIMKGIQPCYDCGFQIISFYIR